MSSGSQEMKLQVSRSVRVVMLSLVLQSVCLGGAVGKVQGVQQVTSLSGNDSHHHITSCLFSTSCSYFGSSLLSPYVCHLSPVPYSSSSSLQEVTATVTTLIATVMRWETAGEIDLCWTSGGGRDHNSPECVYAMVRHMIAVT